MMSILLSSVPSSALFIATDQDGTSFSPDGKAHMEILDNDPNTAATWDTANLASLQVGVKAAT